MRRRLAFATVSNRIFRIANFDVSLGTPHAVTGCCSERKSSPPEAYYKNMNHAARWTGVATRRWPRRGTSEKQVAASHASDRAAANQSRFGVRLVSTVVFGTYR